MSEEDKSVEEAIELLKMLPKRIDEFKKWWASTVLGLTIGISLSKRSEELRIRCEISIESMNQMLTIIQEHLDELHKELRERSK